MPGKFLRVRFKSKTSCCGKENISETVIFEGALPYLDMEFSIQRNPVISLEIVGEVPEKEARKIIDSKVEASV